MTPLVFNDKMKELLVKEFLKKLEGAKNVEDTIKIEQTMKLKPDQKMQVTFTTKAFMKMLILVMDYSSEIAWHGTVDRIDEHSFVITDILVYPQKVTGATVDVDEKQYEEWIASLDEDTANHIRFQGHSHVRMSVSPSKTDMEQQTEIIDQINGEDYYIFAIVNKDLMMNIWVYDMKSGMKYSAEDIDIVIGDHEITEGIDDVRDDADEMVEVPKYTAPKKEPKKKSKTEYKPAPLYDYSKGYYGGSYYDY